jgi:hypothetical protein
LRRKKSVQVLTGLPSSFDNLRAELALRCKPSPERYTASRPRQLQVEVYRREVVNSTVSWSGSESTTQFYPLSYLDTWVLFVVKKGKCYDLEAYIKAVAPSSGKRTR